MSRYSKISQSLVAIFSGSIGGTILFFILQVFFPSHPPEAPTAVAEASEMTGKAPLQVTFYGLASSDDKGVDELRYRWEMGGSTLSERATFDHTFEEPGAYTIILLVTDSDDLSGREFVNIDVTGAQSDTPQSSPNASANEQDLGQSDLNEADKEVVVLSNLRMDVTDGGLPGRVVAEFPQELDVTGVVISLKFADDLWDPGESWHLESVGGQRNLTKNSRNSTKLRIPSLNKHIADQFRNGRFVGYLRAESGSFRVTEIEFSLTGSKRQ